MMAWKERVLKVCSFKDYVFEFVSLTNKTILLILHSERTSTSVESIEDDGDEEDGSGGGGTAEGSCSGTHSIEHCSGGDGGSRGSDDDSSSNDGGSEGG